MCNLIKHTHIVPLIPPWEDRCEWHRMTWMTGPDCAVMCNLINTHTHTHTQKNETKQKCLISPQPHFLLFVLQPALRAGSNGGAARDNADTRMVSSPPKARLRKGKTHGKKPRESATEAAPTKSSRDLEVGAHPSPAELLPSGPGKRNPRKHTLSIALPGSVVDNAQNRELKTYLVRPTFL